MNLSSKRVILHQYIHLHDSERTSFKNLLIKSYQQKLYRKKKLFVVALTYPDCSFFFAECPPMADTDMARLGILNNR